MKPLPSAKVVKQAAENGYAVAAINCQGGNYDIVRAVLETVEEEQAPVIVMAYEKNTEYYGIDWLLTLVKALSSRYTVPVGVQLDHGKDIEAFENAVDLGCTSVKIDYSTTSLPENISAGSRIISAAAGRGVSVEVELGELQRNQTDAPALAAENLVDPKDVEQFLTPFVVIPARKSFTLPEVRLELTHP